MNVQKKIVLVLSLFITQYFSVSAQDSLKEKRSPWKLNTDLVTSYLWRGAYISNVPNIQPYLSYTKGGFEAGGWGSLSINGEYSELDLYATYTLGNFGFSVYDYFSYPDDPRLNYFDYSAKSTSHLFEGSILFSGTEKIPLQLLAATFFYGNDFYSNDGSRSFSTYLEATYSFPEIDLILGASPWKGMYCPGFSVIHAGFRLNKKVRVTKEISLPVSLSLLSNPRTENIYFVAAMTF
jgi:hypothetical protein